MATVAVTAFLFSPTLVRPRGTPEGDQLWGCKSNLKNLGTALDMYAEDNHGLYPMRLKSLTDKPYYLKTIPTCPSVRRMTFTDYVVSPDGKNFSVSCVGDNHRSVYGLKYAGSSVNYPRYNAEEGLGDHP